MTPRLALPQSLPRLLILLAAMLLASACNRTEQAPAATPAADTAATEAAPAAKGPALSEAPPPDPARVVTYAQATLEALGAENESP